MTIGHLGVGVRFESGPSDRLVQTGFTTETGHALYLHRWLGYADLAHVLALREVSAIEPEPAALLLTELLRMQALDPAEFPYEPVHGDAYNSREHALAQRLGTVAGWLHLGRTRREACRIAFWLATRDALLDLHEAVASLAKILAQRARELATAWWADMTYLQPAQVSSFGHYLLTGAHESARHLMRVRRAWAACAQLPVVAGGVAGTGVPLVRASYLARLGVSARVTTTRDAMWATDNLVEVMSASLQAVLSASRLAEDYLLFCSPAFGYLRLHDGHCRASVHLPQKRNPYALAVVRGGASSLIGRTTGLLASIRTPTAQSDNWIHNYGDVLHACTQATSLVGLLAEVTAAMTVDTRRMRELAFDGYTDAADVAERIVAETGTDYRSAYRRVGRAATAAEARGSSRLEDQDYAALGLTGAAPTDPGELVGSRTTAGGAAPAEVRAGSAELLERVSRGNRWRANARRAADTAVVSLLAEANAAAG
jgi:argininosuccinate lyase